MNTSDKKFVVNIPSRSIAERGKGINTMSKFVSTGSIFYGVFCLASVLPALVKCTAL